MLGYLNCVEEEAVNKLNSLLSHKLGNNLKDILLYGSQACGDYNSDSDIDILVIADVTSLDIKEAIRDIVLDIQLEYGLPISVHIRSLDYFTVQQNNKLNLFIHNIKKEGIRIYS